MLIAINGAIDADKDEFGKILQYWVGIYRNKQEGVLGFSPSLHDYLYFSPIELGVYSNIEVHKFADALKDITCRMLGCTRAQLEDKDFKNSYLPEEWRAYYMVLKTAVHPIDKETGRISEFYASEQEVKNHWTNGEEPKNGFEIGNSIVTYQKFLQLLDKEAIRYNIHPNAHVNMLMREYKPIPVQDYNSTHWQGHAIALPEVEKKYPDWVITDCSAPNQADAVRKAGGIVVKILRNKQWDRTCLTCMKGFDFCDIKDLTEHFIEDRRFTDYSCPHCGARNDAAVINDSPMHESETALADYPFDAYIYNTGTLDDLLQMGGDFVSHFKLYKYANTNTAITTDNAAGSVRTFMPHSQ